jgi:hypothetical protein
MHEDIDRRLMTVMKAAPKGRLSAGYFLRVGFRMTAGFFAWTSRLGLQPVMLVGNSAHAMWLTLRGLLLAGGGTTYW